MAESWGEGGHIVGFSSIMRDDVMGCFESRKLCAGDLWWFYRVTIRGKRGLYSRNAMAYTLP